jgi:hypothetical protein
MESIALVVGLIVSLLSLFTGVGGAIAWFQAKTRKEYAAERDFNHLKNNQAQLALNVEQLWRLMDTAFREQEQRLSDGHDQILFEIAKIQPPK